MTCNLIPFKIEHIDQFTMRSIDRDLFAMRGSNKEIFKVCEQGYGATYIRNGEVIGCGGVFPLWEGVGQCWMTASQDYKKHWLSVARYMKTVIDVSFKLFNFHRIQGTTKASYTEGIKFLEWAGFEREGELKGYGVDKENHIMYARLNNVI